MSGVSVREPGRRRLLFVSNGHGEDALACQLINRLVRHAPPLSIEAWRIVGANFTQSAFGITLGGFAVALDRVDWSLGVAVGLAGGLTSTPQPGESERFSFGLGAGWYKWERSAFVDMFNRVGGFAVGMNRSVWCT